MLGALLVVMATGMATTLGAVPFLFVEAIPRRVYDSLLGFGAGLMLAAATLGLLSVSLADVRVHGILDGGRFAAVLGGFLGGVALLYLMDRLIPHRHAGGHVQHVHAGRIYQTTDPRLQQVNARKQGLLVVGVMALHRLPEGFAIGAAWVGGGEALGLTLVFAVGVQNAVEGAVMAAPLRRGGLSPRALIGLVAATGLTVPIGAVGGYFLSSSAVTLAPILALAGGALIYLTCNEVIPESHSHGNEVRATFGLVLGFVFFMIMRVVFGHND